MMAEKTSIFVVGKFTCGFTHRQNDSKPLVLQSQVKHRVWFEYCTRSKADVPKSLLCIWSVIDIRTDFVSELQAAARGKIEQQPVSFTPEIEKKREEPLTFESGMSQGCDDRLSQITRDIKEEAERIIENLRWRLDLSGSGKAIRTAGDFRWSEDGKSWWKIPHKLRVLHEMHREVIVDNLSKDMISLALTPQRLEPVAHSLFRDAWTQRRTDPRAALTQGVSALEVGAKHCIVQLVPDAEYLILEIPSPPVVNLLREYVPKLVQKSGMTVPAIDASVLGSVRDMVHQRNQLVHKGTLTVSADKVSEYLEIIHDLLYYLDFVAGNEWALTLTSQEFKTWIRRENPDLHLLDPLTSPEDAKNGEAS